MHIDKTLFRQTIYVLAVRVEAKKIGTIVKALHENLLNRPRLRNVIPDPTISNLQERNAKQATSKLILLNERIQKSSVVSDPFDAIEGIPADLIEMLKREALGIVEHAIPLDYSYFTVEEVLAKLLPKDLEIPSSFECVGHIAHLNLRQAHIPYKFMIGQVILEKNGPIHTVVNKLDSIETQFRTFAMEVLAGKEDFEVEVHESKARFRFNYAQVYWNSRLQHEHARMIQRMSRKDIICDMMAGVGPFSIPLAMKGCLVYANDLNPHSFHYLSENIQLNKVADKITAYNLDGREFVRKLLKENKRFTQVLMNLPASAIEFLDVFETESFVGWSVEELPWIHCYCFSTSVDAYEEDVMGRIEAVLKGALDRSKVYCHRVRDVAPKKVMMCVSFQLPPLIAYRPSQVQAQAQAEQKKEEEVETVVMKRQKVNAETPGTSDLALLCRHGIEKLRGLASCIDLILILKVIIKVRVQDKFQRMQHQESFQKSLKSSDADTLSSEADKTTHEERISRAEAILAEISHAYYEQRVAGLVPTIPVPARTLLWEAMAQKDRRTQRRNGFRGRCLFNRDTNACCDCTQYVKTSDAFQLCEACGHGPSWHRIMGGEYVALPSSPTATS